MYPGYGQHAAARALLEFVAHERLTSGKAMIMTDRNGTLQVSGTGKVQVAPDEVVIQLGVVTDGKTAAEATASNARRTQSVLDAVSKLSNHSLTTSGLNLSPILSYDPSTSVSSVVGFRATNGVVVKAKPGYAGQIYDAGIEAGANQSGGVSFSFAFTDEVPYRNEALRLAIEDAFREAKTVARAANIELMGPESIQVNSGSGRLVYRSAAIDEKALATPVIPEEQTISAGVNIVFRTRG